MVPLKEFRPLCNEHYSEMVEAIETCFDLGSSEAEVASDACTRHGCARHFDPYSGYYDSTTGGKLQGRFDSPYTCGEHDLKMFVKSYNRLSNTEVWECPAEGCSNAKSVLVGA